MPPLPGRRWVGRNLERWWRLVKRVMKPARSRNLGSLRPIRRRVVIWMRRRMDWWRDLRVRWWRLPRRKASQ
jgi:hypothetical protein